MVNFEEPTTRSPIIPVIDELINVPSDAPKEQQHKIAAFNELLEEVYQRKTELENLEQQLAAMKVEIEGDLAHNAMVTKEIATKELKRRSGTTAIAAFVPSPSPTPTNDSASNPTNTTGSPNKVANKEASSIAALKNISGATKNIKSKGKGKGRQEKAKLNGTDLKYKKGARINYTDEHDDGYDHEQVSDEEYEEKEVHHEEEIAITGVPIAAN